MTNSQSSQPLKSRPRQRSTQKSEMHPTGTQKFVDTAGRVDKFQQRMVKTQAAQAAHAAKSTRKRK
jgi:hypothetical protein